MLTKIIDSEEIGFYFDEMNDCFVFETNREKIICYREILPIKLNFLNGNYIISKA